MHKPGRLLFVLCILPFIALPALASPYGPDVAGRWGAGANLESAGKYAEAIRQYELALAAARKLSGKGMDKKQLDTLRACAVQGSEIRLAGARAGLAALKADSSPAGMRAAAAKAEQAFQVASEEQDRKRPDLVTACP